MSYFLYLDDEWQTNRDPQTYYKLIGREDLFARMQSMKHVCCATVEEAQDYILKNRCPSFISFDNDLGRELEGRHLADWIISKALDDRNFLHPEFNFFVHSQNPIAAEAIKSKLTQLKWHL